MKGLRMRKPVPPAVAAEDVWLTAKINVKLLGL